MASNKKVDARQAPLVLERKNRFTRVHMTDWAKIERTDWLTARMVETYDRYFYRGTQVSFFIQRTTPYGETEPTVQVRIFNGRSERLLTVDQAKRYVRTERDEKGEPVPVLNLAEVEREYADMMSS